MDSFDGFYDPKGEQLAENALAPFLHPFVVYIERPKGDLVRRGGVEHFHVVPTFQLCTEVGIDGDNAILYGGGDVANSLDEHDRYWPAGPRDRNFERLRRGLWTCCSNWGWWIARNMGGTGGAV